ncbi:hypothetical protein BB561_000164 [Smittium simulii]|uniref:Large ribosomal subunit protein uL23m n=1 Tax=Smittium simulii TaxID=133385 RepID=A0A2T9Z0C2_9FUNG|nr:hypothetical protein BB561_000164 [Smittium simulii]
MSLFKQKFGTKRVFFPNLVFSLLRSNKIESNQAIFKVPLYVNKFDIKDYLTHLYNVTVTDVRTYVLPGKPMRDMRSALKILSSREKRAIVTMKEDFHYPPPPDLEMFGKWTMKYQQMDAKRRTKGWRIRMTPQQKEISHKALLESNKMEAEKDK